MKTEQEFNVALKRTMRRTRRHITRQKPTIIARQMGMRSINVYFLYESGYVPISVYQLYQFIQITKMPPDKILEIFTEE